MYLARSRSKVGGTRGPAERARKSCGPAPRAPRTREAGPRSDSREPAERARRARGAGPRARGAGPEGPRTRGGPSEPDRGDRGREIRRPKKGPEKHFFHQIGLGHEKSIWICKLRGFLEVYPTFIK